MNRHTPLSVLILIVIAAIGVACDRTETKTSSVTTSTPAGTSTAPSPAAAGHRDEALVRIVHAVPTAAQLDLFAGDLMLFDGLGFKSVTPYRAIDGQRYAFALKPAGMPRAKPLSSNTEGLEDGHFYTALAMPGDDRVPHLRIVSDQLDTPPAGKALLRIVHAGVDAGTIDVREAGSANTLFDKVAYQTVSDYRAVSPINDAIEIIGGGRALTTFNARLEAGRYYTVVIVGTADLTPRLEAFLIEDALSP
jgi:hypothetical protein